MRLPIQGLFLFLTLFPFQTVAHAQINLPKVFDDPLRYNMHGQIVLSAALVNSEELPAISFRTYDWKD